MPRDILPMCARRFREDIFGVRKDEFVGSYLVSETCPTYDNIQQCVCISDNYVYSPPPPFPPTISAPPVVPCELNPAHSPTAFCQSLELQKRECLRVSGRRVHSANPPNWFMLTLSATCSTQQRVNGSDVTIPSACIDVSNTAMASFINVYDVKDGVIPIVNCLYHSLKAYAWN
eukprot:6212049-Pleurochrysis_carterae.AAC.2